MALPDLPQKVKIVEVGPRDGLQNEKETIPAEIKIELVNRLTAAGFPNIEAASFVSPKWVPQMADAAEVFARITRRPGVRYTAHVLVGPVAEAIVKHAKDKRCDLIYIGTRGMSELGKALVGSTATKVLHISDVPVLLVK